MNPWQCDVLESKNGTVYRKLLATLNYIMGCRDALGSIVTKVREGWSMAQFMELTRNFLFSSVSKPDMVPPPVY
jgi:hypothetical protein